MRRATAIETPTIGIGLGVLAYGMFSMHDATIKWLVAELPVWQVLFCRSLAIVIACLAIGREKLLARAVATPLKASLALRGAITLAAWLCYYTASRSLPLAQLLSLYFASPLAVTVLAAPLLGERVTRARWGAVLVGFRRHRHGDRPAGRAAVAADRAGADRRGAVGLRRHPDAAHRAARELDAADAVYQRAFSWSAPASRAPSCGRRQAWSEVGLLLAIGVIGGLAQFTLFEGCRHAPASVMATVEYTSLIWAFILGYVIWGDIPVPAVFIGAGLILLAGMLLLLAERRAARLMVALPEG